jgi:hypothetical protein
MHKHEIVTSKMEGERGTLPLYILYQFVEGISRKSAEGKDCINLKTLHNSRCIQALIKK